jgi:hypothetical protein
MREVQNKNSKKNTNKKFCKNKIGDSIINFLFHTYVVYTCTYTYTRHTLHAKRYTLYTYQNIHT